MLLLTQRGGLSSNVLAQRLEIRITHLRPLRHSFLTQHTVAHYGAEGVSIERDDGRAKVWTGAAGYDGLTMTCKAG